MEEAKLEFQKFLTERLRDRGFSLTKLSELSNIAVKNLENLIYGRFEKLPAEPYLHGYLLKIGQVLNFDGEAWWQEIKKMGLTKSSGPNDVLPKNRFAKNTSSRKIALLVIGLIAIIYLGLRLNAIIGQPVLTIENPATELSMINQNIILLRGQLKNADRLTINNETTFVNQDYFWEKNFLLQPGLNTVVFRARKFLGREIQVIRQIIYQPPENNPIPTESINNQLPIN